MAGSSSCLAGGCIFSPMWQRLQRKKQLDDSGVSRLDRCLTIPDLTLLSIGAMMGVGIYVLSGQVSKKKDQWRLKSLILKIIGKLANSILMRFRFLKKWLGHPSRYLLLQQDLHLLFQDYAMQKWELEYRVQAQLMSIHT